MAIALIKLQDSNFNEIKHIILNSLDYYEVVENICLKELTDKYLDSKVKDILNEFSEKDKYKNEYRLGILYEGKIIGVVKYLIDFLKPNQAMIGLFLIEKKYRNKNIGKSIFNKIVYLMKVENQKYIRIGVDQKNIKGLKFWKNIGFKIIDTKDFNYGKYSTKINILKIYI